MAILAILRSIETWMVARYIMHVGVRAMLSPIAIEDHLQEQIMA